MKAYNAIIYRLTEISDEAAINFLEDYILYKGSVFPESFVMNSLFESNWGHLSALVNDLTWSSSIYGTDYWDEIYDDACEAPYNRRLQRGTGFSRTTIPRTNKAGETRNLIAEVNGAIVYEMEHTERKDSNKIAKIYQP